MNAITTRLAPLRTVFLTVAAQGIVLWAALGDRRWMEALRGAAGGWLDPNLPAGALVFLLSVVPFVFLRARLRPRDIGLEARKLGRGVVVVAALWLATQLGLALLALLADEPLRPARLWLRPSAPAGPLGFLAAMLVVMTAVEEATFRGFVLPQLWLRLPGSARVRTWGAVLGSAVLFALVHIPSRRFLYGLDTAGLAASLAALVAFGIFMAVIYLRTANLWVAGGVHALMNAPTPLLDAPVPPLLVLVPLVLGLVVLWPRLPGGGRRPLLAGTAIRVDDGDRPTPTAFPAPRS
ncbi:MAG TPA: type II CAAX endopeptidase family protein [Longimicrobiales bacterium]|nr:type II CAAX endopeptidase family protein [Longimicrobiales bacterium]